MAYRSLQPGSRAIQGKPDIVAEYNSFRFWFITKNRIYSCKHRNARPVARGLLPLRADGK